jgi:tartrate dehydrogenase/decarboxylase/D-malate dehydrogenase
VPDHVSLWGSLLKFRREFDQYINLRPVRLFEGVPCPLAGRKPGDIDYFVVRENTEGEYTSLGGVMYEGTEREIVIQESVFSRHGTDRVLRYAFELANSRARKHLTVATKSNGIAISMPWWDGRADAIGSDYPEVTVDKQHIDILSARFVLQPTRFDVVVASNLFGDILSDLGPATTGTIGLAPSANLNPERKFPSLFEPVHGSAPDIYGQNIANPIAMIWSGALMLDFLTQGQGAGRAAHDAILAPSRRCCAKGRARATWAARPPHGSGHGHCRARGRRLTRSLPPRNRPLHSMPLTLERQDLLPGRHLIGAEWREASDAAAST